MAKVVEVAVKTTFRNHLYQFEGKTYIQAEGGSIGLRLTGVVCKIVMNHWMREFKKLVIQNNLTMYLSKIYVDDINLLMEATKKGTRWTGQKLEWRQDWEDEDIEKNEKDDKRTMKEIRLLSNSILPCIQLKEEVASDCIDNKLPMLDFKVWKEVNVTEEGNSQTIIKHEFYEKPVASKLVMMNRSALPHRMKIQTLTQEVIRRQKNTARNVSGRNRKDILTRLMVKMKRSGYDERMRKRILIAGMKGYARMVKVEEEGGRKVNRPRWEGQQERRYKKMGAKTNWYKRRKNKTGLDKKGGRKGKGRQEESDVETVLFVPHTPGGKLAKMMEEEEERFRKGTKLKRIKIVEKGGNTLKSILSCTNPWAKEGCTREDCFPCKGEPGKGGNCQLENIVYRISCLECAKTGTRAEYTGESSRTAYLRGCEHQDGLRQRSDKNAMWKHCVEHHESEEVLFKMKVIRGHKSPLTRQVHEGVEIGHSTATVIMNSKSEWNGTRIPRIVVEVGEQIHEEEGGEQPRQIGGKWKEEKVTKKSGWDVKNLKKRKREEEGGGYQKNKKICNQEPEKANPSVAKDDQVENIKVCANVAYLELVKKRGQGYTECATAQPKLYDCKGWCNKSKIIECGSAQNNQEGMSVTEEVQKCSRTKMLSGPSVADFGKEKACLRVVKTDHIKNKVAKDDQMKVVVKADQTAVSLRIRKRSGNFKYKLKITECGPSQPDGPNGPSVETDLPDEPSVETDGQDEPSVETDGPDEPSVEKANEKRTEKVNIT